MVKNANKIFQLAEKVNKIFFKGGPINLEQVLVLRIWGSHTQALRSDVHNLAHQHGRAYCIVDGSFPYWPPHSLQLILLAPSGMFFISVMTT